MTKSQSQTKIVLVIWHWDLFGICHLEFMIPSPVWFRLGRVRVKERERSFGGLLLDRALNQASLALDSKNQKAEDKEWKEKI
jgi:hypothetical protein